MSLQCQAIHELRHYAGFKVPNTFFFVLSVFIIILTTILIIRLLLVLLQLAGPRLLLLRRLQVLQTSGPRSREDGFARRGALGRFRALLEELGKKR